MSKFRALIENIDDIKQWLSQDSSFVTKLKKGCGITGDINKGGLILPDGTLINCFPDSHLMHYDSLPFIYPERISPEEYGSFPKEEDMFDNDVIDNNIIRYSINHSIQEAYIKLPGKNITKAQLDKLQDIFMSLKPGQRIPVMIEDNIFKVVYANNSSNAKDILFDLSQNKLTEGEKKVFDKESGYNSSLDEEYIFEKLKEKWPDVIMSYTDDRFVNPKTHRHFQCDLYVPSKDWFINYNKTWTHFSEPYNPSNPEHQADLNWLKSMAKPGNYYERTIKQWTKTDPIKREVAKEHGFRLIEFFNLREFENWYNNPELTYEEYKDPNPRRYDSDDYFKQKAAGFDPRGNDSDPYAD